MTFLLLLQLRHPDPAGHHQLAERDGDALGHLPMDLGQLPLLQDGRQRMEGKSPVTKMSLFLKRINKSTADVALTSNHLTYFHDPSRTPSGTTCR